MVFYDGAVPETIGLIDTVPKDSTRGEVSVARVSENSGAELLQGMNGLVFP
jgi:hypothetical protein